MKLNPPFFRSLAAGLLLCLGAARGVGGLALLLGDRPVQTDAVTVAGVALGLLFTAALLVTACTLLWWQHRAAIATTVAAVTIFFMGGLINGLLLFGQPTVTGTLANGLLSALVLGLLVFTRRPPGPDHPGETAA